jgi:ribonuclease BN (tRNA processing enzyme)
MKLKVLGSSGAEFGRYNLPAFLVDRCLLLDAGTIGMAIKEVEQWKIRCILITHAHFDHIKGIPFFAENLHMRHKRYGVTIMSIPHVLAALQNNLFNNILWPDFTKIPDTKNPVLKLRKITPGESFHACGHKVTAFRVNHSVPAVGYIIEDVKGKRLLYTGDTSPTDSIWRATDRIDCVIMEVSFPNRMEEFAIKSGHLTPRLIVKELQKMESLPGKVLITHQKPLYLKQIHREIEALRMKNVKSAEDGKTYEI